MRRLRKDVLLALLGLGAFAGVTAAGVSLYRALAAARVLVSIGTVGTRALSEIQFDVEADRRTVLEVLAAKVVIPRGVGDTGINGADARILSECRELAGLDLSGNVSAKVAAFQDRWQSYRNVREKVLSAASEGKLEEARTFETGLLSAEFEQVAASLQSVQKGMADLSARTQETVRTGLRRAFTELGALATTMVLFVAMLIWSRRRQGKLLTLQRRSEQLERERARILDMAGRNEPLLMILQALVSVTQEQLPGSIACFSVIQDGRLREVVGPALPKQYLETAYTPGAAVRRIGSAAHRREALVHGLKDCWSQEVLSNKGNQIGRVDIYVNKRPGEAQLAFLEGVAKLASVVIQHREMYEQLAFQATRDPLTNLPNRRLFQDRLEQAIMRAQRYQEKVAVLLIDLDRFKQTNDLLGHRVGDELLCEVAKRVAGCMRRSDTLCRMGGDEFTVLLSPVESVEGAELVLRRIADVLRVPFTVLDHKITVSASIGLSVYPDHSQDSATLLRNADLAMYHAKERCKNGWQTYVPELGAVMLRRMSIEKALEGAIENEELEVNYQVQTDLQGRLTGAEALLRWRNPELGQVFPSTFIPVAEESGLIVSIGAWVMERACCQAAAWHEAGLSIGRIAINISARQLVQTGFTDGVRYALKSSGLTPDCLELELTETALMYDLENCMNRLQELRDLGVSIAIDDFGTGYSSLFYLQRLPVSRVKIDQSFVQAIRPGSQETIPLIRAIVDLAHGLGLTVIAEGVETEVQREALALAGCDQMQGYLIHRPQTASQLTHALSQFSSGVVQRKLALAEMRET